MRNWGDAGREKLQQSHDVVIGRETLHKLMRDAGLWSTRAARRNAIQQVRARQPYYGENDNARIFRANECVSRPGRFENQCNHAF